MITIKDIADKAGVSFTTVSNVIHGNDSRVSKETSDNIKSIMKDMNYVPNMAARNLVGRGSKIIGVVSNLLKEEDNYVLKDPFMLEVLGAVESEIRHRGYYMMLYASNSFEDIKRLITTWNVEGLILIGIDPSHGEKVISTTQTPVTFLDCYFSNPDKYVNVGLDDEKGGYEITKYLLEQGHRKIAFADDFYGDYHFGDLKPGGVDEWRYMGYRRALKEYDIEYVEDNFITLNPIKEKRMKDLTKLCQRIHDFSAIFFTSDYHAVEAINYFRTQSISVPDDISVVGFDDIFLSKMCYPALTTVHQDVGDKGILLVKQLIRLIEDGKVEETNIKLPIKVIVRDSVKKLN